MDGYLRQDEIGSYSWVDNFNFWCVNPNDFFEVVFPSFSDFLDGLAPEGEDRVFISFYLKIS